MEKENNFKSTLFEYLRVIVCTVIVCVLFLHFVQISKVVGISMEPTYHDGNVILVDKFFYKNKEPQHDDIVVAHYALADEHEQIIKRVVGIPGDHIEMKDNRLYRNDQLLDESYILEPMENNNDFSYDIPKGKVFVMGDNRNHSVDSRLIGYLDFEEDIVGRVFLRVFN